MTGRPDELPVTIRLIVVLVCAFTSQPAARAQIFQPGTQPAGEDGGIEVGIQAGDVCRRCHGMYDVREDYEPWDTWRGTLMGSAGRDPVFRAGLAIAEEDDSDAPDLCIRCHSPPAWLSGRSRLPEWSVAGGPRLARDVDGFPSNDLDGVTCMVCHRIDGGRPPGTPAPELANAQIYYLDGRDGDLRLGPYRYTPGTGPAHPADQSDYTGSSELCGSCHDIFNPLVAGRRADGTPTGRPFAIERTYSEWYASAFRTRGETCISCHMPRMDRPVFAADGGGGPRDYFRRHDLAGGTRWVPLAIASRVPDTAGDLGRAFMESAERADAMLRGAATVEISGASLSGDTASATVRVTNLAGHKLPTGYPEGRRMWLEVTLVDEGGATVGGSGLFDEEAGDLRRPADPQLRTYEVQLGEGATPSFHFILDDTVLVDTRIPPEGFAPEADRDMDVVGRDYSDGAGGFHNWDEVSYTFSAVCGTGAITLRARLRYQSTTREYIEFLRDTTPDSLDPEIDNWGRISHALWMTQGGRVPSDLAEASVALGPAPAPCPIPDAGTPPDAGPPPDAGTPPDAGAAPMQDAGRAYLRVGGGGCDCSLAGGRLRASHGAPVALLGGLMLLIAGRRRGRFLPRRISAPRRRPR